MAQDSPYLKRDGTLTTRIQEATRIFEQDIYDFNLQFTEPEDPGAYNIIQISCTTKDAEALGKLLEHHKVPVDEFYPTGTGPLSNDVAFWGWSIADIEENME